MFISVVNTRDILSFTGGKFEYTFNCLYNAFFVSLMRKLVPDKVLFMYFAL